ncbi:hypothetical protein ECANGB1_693 [Enterospora canceri]|uniref:Uncharacterized protein n=1 Tax=Enterospora canceri TaxID=1081671 RepID=A0A1Y1S7J5_9MICR|nr:hypothetical protein ECANGB1_693 [Enterospora canceri]
MSDELHRCRIKGTGYVDEIGRMVLRNRSGAVESEMSEMAVFLEENDTDYKVEYEKLRKLEKYEKVREERSKIKQMIKKLIEETKVDTKYNQKRVKITKFGNKEKKG